MRRRRSSGLSGLLLLAAAVISVTVVFGVSGCSLLSRNGSGSATLASATNAYKAGDFAQAEKLARAALKRNPKDAATLRVLALALAGQGKNGDAIETYGRIVALLPNDDTSWYGMAVLERVSGMTAKSAEHLKQAATLKPDSSIYLDELARAQMALGQFREAAKLWGELATKSGLSKTARKSALVLQGQAYQSAKKYKEAKKAYVAALKLTPGDDALRARVESFE